MTLSVVANGTSPLGYKWFYNSTPLTNGGGISGADAASLVISGVGTTNDGNYSVIVTNVAGGATSSPASLIVVMPPHFSSIASLPDNNILVSINAVSNVSYRIDASSNLLNWDPLTNLPNPAGVIQFMDLDATNYPSRFYRAVWTP